jgi:hypothetical protein
MIPPGSLLAYQADFAATLRDVVLQSWANAGVRTWGLAFKDYGAYHEFNLTFDGDAPDLRVIVKASNRVEEVNEHDEVHPFDRPGW